MDTERVASVDTEIDRDRDEIKGGPKMPCNSDHMEPNTWERESVKVLSLLHEVGLRKSKPDFYGSPNTLGHDTAELCTWCKAHDVSKQSLELQIWWRDHQRWDAKREEHEREERESKAARARALKKLTARERQALGI